MLKPVAIAAQLMSTKVVGKQHGRGRMMLWAGMEKASPDIEKPIVLRLGSPPRCVCGDRVSLQIDI